MIDDDRAFIRGILSEPTNDVARLVYADWLDEQEDPRGEFLRLEVAEARGELASPSNDPNSPKRRLRYLRHQLDPFWLAMIERPLIEKCPKTIQFEFECPKQWDNLDTTENDLVRFCPSCQKNVYFCHTIDEAVEHAWRRECVAVAPQVPRQPRDLDVTDTVTMGMLPEPDDAGNDRT